MNVKFFCESCKYEVPLESESCPSCGKVFYSVLCPRCGREGYPHEFKSGCPKCGYMRETLMRAKRRRNLVVKKKKTMPLWVYQIGAVILSLAVIALVIYIFVNNLLPK
ncbi:MAG: zinc ribbon domain-containing protein [Spirochaetales bacterium]|nr:zinc ribbon domain-containing protein [Spirochaetales bacterium]